MDVYIHVDTILEGNLDDFLCPIIDKNLAQA